MPAWITPEFLEEVASPDLFSLSSTTTESPRSEAYFAIDKPITPEPIIATSKILILYKVFNLFKQFL